MKLRTTIPILLATGLSMMMACKGNENDSDPGALGKVKGTIIDPQGKPVAGANVVVDNTLLYNSNILTTTDSQGKYEVELPIVGTYVVTASIVKQFNGQLYTLDLHPENTNALSNEGGIRNFTLKLSGKKPDGMSSYYGGTVSLNSVLGSELSDPENMEFTLTPMGKLIDGSIGQTLKLKPGAPFTATYGYLVDIPIGRYKMEATYLKNNTPIAIQFRKLFDSSSAFTHSFQLDFEPNTSVGNNIAIIEYSE